MPYDETPSTKSTGVNILDHAWVWWGVGIWYILFRQPTALRHSFKMGRTFQKADNTPDTQLTEKDVCNKVYKDCGSAAIRDNNCIIYYQDQE